MCAPLRPCPSCPLPPLATSTFHEHVVRSNESSRLQDCMTMKTERTPFAVVTCSRGPRTGTAPSCACPAPSSCTSRPWAAARCSERLAHQRGLHPAPLLPHACTCDPDQHSTIMRLSKAFLQIVPSQHGTALLQPGSTNGALINFTMTSTLDMTQTKTNTLGNGHDRMNNYPAQVCLP